MKALSSLVPVVVVLVLGHSSPAASASAPVVPPALLVSRAPTLVPALVPALVRAPVDPDPFGVWPLRPAPAVVHEFDPPDSPWGTGHRGVDLAGSVGQSVHSAMVGVVAFVGHIAGKPVVTISHGDTRTTYEPVSSDLGVGDAVAAGQRIGSLELAFSHCFPQSCLHWGWLRGETYLDPLGLVTSTRVRLLPLGRDLPADDGDSQQRPPLSLTALPALPALPYATWSPRSDDFLP